MSFMGSGTVEDGFKPQGAGFVTFDPRTGKKLRKRRVAGGVAGVVAVRRLLGFVQRCNFSKQSENINHFFELLDFFRFGCHDFPPMKDL